MEFEIEGISSNLVMVQPTSHFTKIGEWDLFDVHDASKRFAVRGKVLKCPTRLLHSSELGGKIVGKGEYATNLRAFLNNRSLEYSTEMEVKEGDEVIFNYICHVSCMEDGMWWWEDGQRNPALLLPYDAIYMIIRNGEQIFPNGWVWVEPTVWDEEDVVNERGMVVGDIGVKKAGIGIVRGFGTPNKAYLFDKWKDVDDLKVGDEILFKKTAGIAAEWIYHNTLNKGKFPYYIMQRHDIYAVKNNLFTQKNKIL